ncbi:MAG: energy transducer TonB, partial [Deltaproteobacteria bacterium]|nr:energy transducer TonB [Deltaproteobacteria bacterium]
FGVRYGRATAGRLEVKTRDPNDKRLHVVADLNLYHATALVEGPVSDTVSVAVAARRSYVDAVLNAAQSSFPEEAPGFTVAPRYYDYQAKVTWKAGAHDTLRLNLFGSDDEMKMVGVQTGGLEDIDAINFATRFGVLGLSWDHQPSPQTRLNVSLSESILRTEAKVGGFFNDKETYAITGLRLEGSHEVLPSLRLSAGIDSRILPWGHLDLSVPPIPSPNEIYVDAEPNHYDKTLAAVEVGGWVEAVWKPLPSVTIVPGVRFDYENFIFEGWWFDPRLAARWTLVEGTTVKGGVGLYHQPPPIAYATEDWGNPDLGAEGSWQYSLGVEQRIWGPLSADVQLYYKDMFDLSLPNNRVITRGGELVPERYSNEGTGSAYGAELLLRYDPDGRFSGWIAYSLSKSKRDQSVVGGTFYANGDDFDQPHNLTALGTLELPEIWNGLSVGFRLRYSTGNPYRKYVRSIYDVDTDSYQGIPEAQRSSRMPAFFQLDARIDKKWTFQTWTLNAYLDVQNATNRGNAEQVVYAHDYSESGYATGMPIFPSIGLRGEY